MRIESAGAMQALAQDGEGFSLPHVTQHPLFGTPPPDLADLYSLYATKIAANIGMHSEKPVVVGLALPRIPQADDTDYGAERERLNATMELLAECRVW